MSAGRPDNRIVAVVGTNASGKSELAVRIARGFDGEIISADSRQVYRGLHLGTGKLSIEERAGIVHHLLDVVDVGEEFSVAHYQRLAYEAVDKVIKRHALPIIVGGTGLYVEAVVYGYSLVDVPPNPALRLELLAKPTEELALILKDANEDTASHIELHNKRRIVRALEIHYGGFGYAETRQRKPRYEALMLGLTWPWDVLCERIDRRLQKRLEQGMIGEVRDLLSSGVPTSVLDALGLEYRHVLRYLTGEYRTESELYESLRRAIRKFARRQMSWFRRDKRIIWLNTLGDYCVEAEMRISDWLKDTHGMSRISEGH